MPSHMPNKPADICWLVIYHLNSKRKKRITQIFHIKKSLLIDKSHLQKHVETLEDTAYVHCVFATLQLLPPWDKYDSLLNNYQKDSKGEKSYLYLL